MNNEGKEKGASRSDGRCLKKGKKGKKAEEKRW